MKIYDRIFLYKFQKMKMAYFLLVICFLVVQFILMSYFAKFSKNITQNCKKLLKIEFLLIYFQKLLYKELMIKTPFFCLLLLSIANALVLTEAQIVSGDPIEVRSGEVVKLPQNFYFSDGENMVKIEISGEYGIYNEIYNDDGFYSTCYFKVIKPKPRISKIKPIEYKPYEEIVENFPDKVPHNITLLHFYKDGYKYDHQGYYIKEKTTKNNPKNTIIALIQETSATSELEIKIPYTVKFNPDNFIEKMAKAISKGKAYEYRDYYMYVRKGVYEDNRILKEAEILLEACALNALSLNALTGKGEYNEIKHKKCADDIIRQVELYFKQRNINFSECDYIEIKIPELASAMHLTELQVHRYLYALFEGYFSIFYDRDRQFAEHPTMAIAHKNYKKICGAE